MKNNNLVVLTGAMGAGKSTILKILKKKGLFCVDEPARQILAEQRAIHGSGVPENNPALFTDLLLSRAMHQYQSFAKTDQFVIFDRGLPDNIAYCDLFGLDRSAAWNASQLYQYNKKVFILSGWKDIYQTDDERKMTYEQADEFGKSVEKIYQALGYDLIEVPFEAPEVRAEFIVSQLI